MQQKSKVVKTTRVRVGPKWGLITNTLFDCNVDTEIKLYRKIADRYLKTNGPKWTCARLKDYYNLGVRLALDINVSVIPFCRTRGGIPLDMLPFVPKLKSKTLYERRACLTVLRSYTQLHSEPDRSIVTIVNKGPDESLFEEYRDSFSKISKKYKVFLKPKIYDTGLFTTSKKGPNGPALLNVDKDYVAIKESGTLSIIRLFNEELGKILLESKGTEVSVSGTFGSEFDYIVNPDDLMESKPRTQRKEALYDAMESFTQWQRKRDPQYYENVNASRISFIAEGGCKTRVIAIGDYFTQDCLKPLHKTLYKLLSQLDTDGTSSHNRISQLVKDRTSKGKYVGSFDLTAFTDRFPVFIQEFVLSQLFNSELAKLWRQLLVDREFDCDGDKVRYGCGQPMGFLSSWAVAAITHHITIEACALRVGKTSFKDYCLIGDDVTIFDKTVSDEYRKFLEHFSISISEAKSLTSDGKPSSAEIAKRIFKDGEELSPLPYDAIESAIKDYLLFPNLLRLAIERGININDLDVPVQRLLKDLYPKGGKSDNCLCILSYPGQKLPLGITSEHWLDYSIEEIQSAMEHIRFEYVTRNAMRLYNVELQTIPDMGHIGVALDSDLAPAGLDKHPLMVVLRHYRDRCGSIFQNFFIRRIGPSDLGELLFLVNPMIPQYMRRSHMIERINSTLILKAHKFIKNQSGN